MSYLLIATLLVFSGVFSGLTLGFFSLNKADLERKAQLGDKQAKKIYSVRKNGNLLLCTLIVANVAVNTTLSILLGNLLFGMLANITATALIVIFGEIIPQALFSRHALHIGSKFAWFVQIFMYFLYPICWPISKVLDRYLGDEMPTIYSKKELMKIIEEHENADEKIIDADEEKILKGALSFSEKIARNIMTPRTAVKMLDFGQKLDKSTLLWIKNSGYSRVPVYKKDKDNIVGILYTRDILGKDTRKLTAGKVARKNVFFVEGDKPLDDLFNAFKKTKCHLFVVLNEFSEFAGIVTIEDVIEEIVGERIPDEFKGESKPEAIPSKKTSRNLRRV
ncbi:MAG: HlyC/CorC family transporter [Candidatus Aenigmarchaeota archaeon]|nr:HlyC/CorC family transporter [Candidatus Aenigmarchaeota archaeon]